MTYVMGREGREKFSPNSYSPNSAEPLSSPDSPSVSLSFFHPPQQFQTSSIPLTCPTQSHTASPLSSYSCCLEKKEKYQPQAIYPTARPAPPPADLYQEAKANLSTKTLQLIYSAFSGTSTSLLIPYHQHLNIFPQKPSQEVMIFFSQFLINPKRQGNYP